MGPSKHSSMSYTYNFFPKSSIQHSYFANLLTWVSFLFLRNIHLFTEYIFLELKFYWVLIHFSIVRLVYDMEYIYLLLLVNNLSYENCLTLGWIRTKFSLHIRMNQEQNFLCNRNNRLITITFWQLLSPMQYGLRKT